MNRRSDPPRKAGYQIRTSVFLAVRDAVERGEAESQNAFVERALIRELKELRRRRLYEEYGRAAGDPAFVTDMKAISDAFEPASGDGLED
jgi:hypothetical protein